MFMCFFLLNPSPTTCDYCSSYPLLVIIVIIIGPNPPFLHDPLTNPRAYRPFHM